MTTSPGDWLRDDGSVLAPPDVLNRVVPKLEKMLDAQARRDGGGNIDRAVLDFLHVLAESARLQEIYGNPVLPPPAPVQAVRRLSSVEAAEMHGLTDRRIRQLAHADQLERLGFLSWAKVGRTWVLEAPAA